jgi:hypothetical protein
MPKGRWDLMKPRVVATFSDGEEVFLFDYFSDELRFREKEFIGLTEEQGRELFHTKDVAYLRS